MELVRLDWAKDVAGYTLGPRRSRKGRRVGVAGANGLYIVRKSGKFQTTWPLATDGLWKQLINTPPNAKGALDFVGRHGFLFDARAEAEPVERVIRTIKQMRSIAQLLEFKEWDIAAWRLRKQGDNAFNGGFGALGVQYSLRPNGELPDVYFRPRDLQSAIYVQMFMDAAHATNLRPCRYPQCPEWFKYGPGTSHRGTAIYCSRECKERHRNELRKEK